MNTTIDQLRVIVSVAHFASFSEAARELQLTQPSVSRTVQTVESTVGTSLFTRSTRRVNLTADGIEFISVAEEILDAYDAGLLRFTAFQRADRGLMTVAALPVLAGGGLAPIVADFLFRHPNVQVQLVTGSAKRVLQLLHTGGADVAVTELPAEAMGLVATPLGKDPLRAAVRADHPLAEEERVDWMALSAEHFIQFSEGTSVRRLTDEGFARAGVRPQSSITADATVTAIAMLAQGFGVTALPESSRPLVASADLRFIPLGAPEITRDLAILAPESPAPSTLARFFIQAVVGARVF